MLGIKFGKIMKDIQWSFVALATASLSHLLLRIVLGRELGPSGLGVYTLVYTIYMLGMQFAAFGLGNAITKYVAEFSDALEKAKEFISVGIVSSFLIGTLMGAFLYIGSYHISVNIFKVPEMIYLLKITAIVFPFMAIYKVVLGALNGFRDMKNFALANIALNAFIFLVSVFFVINLKMHVKGAVLGFVLPTIVLGILSIYFIYPYLKIPKSPLLKNETLKNLLNFGFYVVLGNSIGYIYLHIDSLMIGYYLTETEVGLYAVAVIFIQGVSLIPSAAQNVTNPIIAQNFAKKQYETILTMIKNITSKVLLASIIISMIAIIFGETLIVTIFGMEFLSAYHPLIILLIGYTFYSPFRSIGTFYSSIGHVQLSYKIALFTAAMNILLNLLLIPKYNIIGASMATSISLIIMTLVHFAIIRHFVRVSWGLKSRYTRVNL
ncbi:flippase [Methanolobus bombayensis]|uniref:flippase n=1 Tax=Methanolobus bombayensis TaxID=38023 RepID=UPI001AE2E8FA|nr:flippase [Methanolobus bombayensis]MBP1910660.1 O-antigen/teichoic acid export membrane protein [Methanolobus bombayensis]